MYTGESGGEPPHSIYASLVGKLVGLRVEIAAGCDSSAGETPALRKR
jgi:hypothetical protein